MPAQLRDVVLRHDAAFGDDDAILRRTRGEIDSRLQRDVERFQIAVVDADERRLELQRAFQFCLVVRFDENIHPVVDRAVLELSETRIIQRGDDQQDRISTERP